MDIETILYIIVFIGFVVARIFKGMKKAKEDAPTYTPPKPDREFRKQKPEKTETGGGGTFGDVFGELMKEIQQQQEQYKQPEQKPVQIPKPKPQPKRAVATKYRPIISETEERKLIEQEGVSAFKKPAGEPVFSWELEGGSISEGYKEMVKSGFPAEVSDDDYRLEFNPREAFMLKTLLERKY